MPWPDTALPVVVEIAPGASPAGDPTGAAWSDVTASARVGDGITIEEGRGDWGEDVDPGKCALVFNNPDGHFSEHNPLGQWYGLLGRDTPLRVRLRRVEDAFGRTVSNGWGTSDSGQAWITSGGAASDYSTTGTKGRHSVGVVNSTRATVVDGVALADVNVSVRCIVATLATGAPITFGLYARYVDSSNFYLARVACNTDQTITLIVSKTVAGATTTLGTYNHPTETHTVGDNFALTFQLVGSTLRAKVLGSSADPLPGGWMVVATDSALDSGTVGCRSRLDAGNTNALPVAIDYDDFKVRVDLFGGFVPAWVPRSDLSGKVRTVPVVAKGVLYRLKPGQAKPPARSPLRRTIGGSGPVAYWPVEDGPSSGQVASALPDHPPLQVTGATEFVAPEDVQLTTATLKYGTSAVANLAGGGRLSATVPGQTTVATATATGWTAAVTAQIPGTTLISADVVLLEVETPGGGTYARWQLRARKATSETQVVAITAGGTEVVVINTPGVTTSFALHDFSVWQNGPNIEVGLAWSSFAGAFDAAVTTGGTLSGGVTAVRVNPGGTTASAPMPAGHVALWAGHPMPVQDFPVDANGNVSFGALQSYRLETAHARLARLAAEDGIPVTVPPVDPAFATQMGWQPIGTPLELYRECEAADGGVLRERPFRLEFKPRANLYGQAAALALNSGDLAAAPVPDTAGQRYRNRWEIKRVNGSSATADAPEVAQGAIVYEDSAELNLADDSRLTDIASWNLHLTSGTGLRWPRLALNLATAPQLLDAWLNVRVGSRITVANPPADVAGQDIDVLYEGGTITLGYKNLEIDANCSPAKLWDVATVDGDQRVAADGSTLAVPLALGAMSLSLASTPANGLWTTDAADFPLDVRVGGERVTLSVITGAASPQTAAISARGVNGVTRAWNAGTEVDVWNPAIVAL